MTAAVICTHSVLLSHSHGETMGAFLKVNIPRVKTVRPGGKSAARRDEEPLIHKINTEAAARLLTGSKDLDLLFK